MNLLELLSGGRVVPRIPVLGYHHVHRGPDDFFRTSPELFRQQMELLLREGYTPIAPAQLAAMAGRRADERYVMVTFDDAYVDFRQYAWPILRELRIPAVLFVISDYIGGWNDWDRIRWDRHPHLDATAIAELHREGVIIGSHSRTHPVLFRLRGSALREELAGSRRALEIIIGAPVPVFAYPGGAVDWRVRRATAATYDLAFATVGRLRGATCDRFRIPRFDPCFCGNQDVFLKTLDEHRGVLRSRPR
jgi:peptidoglycan/xylan/chitin deacetylase (PgdA/CDA1 family)